jgi:HD-GYP domain-containing protein (c-di-GMP phosphodiesterase class II)
MDVATGTPIARALIDSGYSRIALDRLARQAAEILGADASRIFVRDPTGPGTTIVAAAHGEDEQQVGRRMRASAERAHRRDVAAVKLRWGGAVRGALAVRTRGRGRRFSRREVELLEDLGEIASAAILHVHARTVLAPGLRSQADRLTGMVDARDGYTASHSEAIVATTRAVGERLDLAPATLAELELGALLHDIGKVRVPDSILHKPGPLTADERALMNRHPVWGAELLTRVPGLEPVAAIVRFHHERWDGGGYPAGLSGTRIPLPSRIIAACDAHHAMTSDRPYRAALSGERALAELHAGAGTQFDPCVVAELEAVLATRGLSAR